MVPVIPFMPLSRKGFSLAEMLVAIPLLAVITVGLAYFSTAYSLSNAQTIGRFRCQIAVHNLMTLVQAASTTPVLDVMRRHIQNNGIAGMLLASSPAHPDGTSALTVSSDISAFNGYSIDFSDASVIPFHISVTDDSTGARSAIITYVSR